jgi:GntR family transcriptional regulator/MocR family aminotransferase
MTRGKAAIPLDLPRPAGLSSGGAHVKQDCIADALRAAILNRLLPCGSMLPSTRTLAERWGVARGTVEASFDRLRAEGYVARVRGAGTRVSAVVPDSYLSSPAGAVPPPAVAPPPAPPLPEATVSAGVPFVARMADTTLLRQDVWRRHMLAGLRGAGAAELGAPPPQGMPGLRHQIAHYLGKYRGIACRPDDVFITTGIRHSIDLIARAVLGPGSKVLMEDPGYPSARQLFMLAGADTVDVPVDREGFDAAALARHRDAAAVYVTPAHQSPLGVTMSVSRRLELLELAGANGAWVIEDDYDGEFGYQAAPLPALKALDVHDRVIYCGSFNKSLFSGLRVGFMVVPHALRRALFALWHATGRSVGVNEQLALASLIESDDFARHLRVSRQAYLLRRDAVLEQLRRHAPGQWTATGEHAGFHFVLWLAPDVDEDDLVRRAAAHGLRLQPLRALCRTARLPPALVIGYTALTPAQARHAGRLLAQLLAGKAPALPAVP